MTLIKAYQAYQKANYELCSKLLNDLGNDSRKLDLQAQLYFKQKEYQKAYDILSLLIDKEDEYSIERKENLQLLLVCARLEQPGSIEVKSPNKVPDVDDIIDQVELINLKDNSVRDLSSKAGPEKKVRKPRKRKIRLPKQYDPVAGPDPERWLPRRDRKSTVHKQKRRRQRQNNKGKTRAK